jgi:hypothetical protein
MGSGRSRNRLARRIALEVLGWLLVAGGVAALVLPGPGALMLFAGLALLSEQYAWARRWVRPVERWAMRTAAEGVQTWPRIILSSLFALALCAVGVLWMVHPRAPGRWPVDDRWWLVGGWPTGLTILASGLLALGMIVYSFRRFRGLDHPKAAAEAHVEQRR